MILIKNGTIVNERASFLGSILINKNKIEEVFRNDYPKTLDNSCETIDATGKIIIPGIIDDQVHFREPGLTNKASIYTEAKAAIAGGITSFMEMPNTNPQTTTQTRLEEKFNIAADNSLANYSFYIGATNDNLDELIATDPLNVCGIKVFMGSSTGNMLVEDPDTLSKIFKNSKLLIATHCEDDSTILINLNRYKEQYGENIPIEYHHLIRSEEACYKSSSFAASLAKKFDTKLHILHLTTKKELSLLSNDISLENKLITGEVCAHHLWFNNEDYKKYGSKIKWNPAVKTENDRLALIDALNNDTLDILATDHAPHTLEEKNNNYTKAPSGGPLVQHSFNALFELHKQGKISLEKIVEKMCHNPSILYNINNRGYIRPGYFADIAIFDPAASYTVNTDNILYKCKWSPFEGTTFSGQITHTMVNGNMVFNNGIFNESIKGQSLTFNR